MSFAARRSAFRDLHIAGCFCLPNPWDGYTTQRLVAAGFKALASTSAGAAWALGKQDGAMSVDEVLAHLRFLVSLTDLPINADFENGFADTIEGLSTNVQKCIDTGVAGLSIEDRNGSDFFPFDESVARIKAARAAIDQSGQNVVLVGRCEAYLMASLNLDEVIRRLRAYADAGADCVYAPGVRALDQTLAIVQSVNRPVNANLTATGLSVADFAAIGVRRVSVGAALAKATYDTFDLFADRLMGEGRLP